MPELPEVEFSRRRLTEWTAGRAISRVETPDPKALNAGGLSLEGRRFVRWERRGKYLVGRLDGEIALLSHLGMTGKWIAEPEADRPHQRLRVHLDGPDSPRSIALVDPRRLGATWLLAATDVDIHPRLNRLGPDAMDPVMTPTSLAARVGSDRRPLKRRLMDQSVVAGLGNIMVAEMCWRAGVHPHRPCDQIDTSTWSRLHVAIGDHVRGVLEEEQGAEILYVSSGGGEEEFLCYGRSGKPCSRCGITFVTGKLDGRTSTWCPGCQPLET